VSLVVYRIWKNNEPQTVIYEPPTKTRSEIEANARIVGGDGGVTGLRHGTRDWADPGDATAFFSKGKKFCSFPNGSTYTYMYWIDDAKNKEELQNVNNAFVYVFGKDHDTSALARAEFDLYEACGQSFAKIEGFRFYVIQGQIDSTLNSEIEFFTKLPSYDKPPYDKTKDKFAMKMNSDTLPDFDSDESLIKQGVDKHTIRSKRDYGHCFGCSNEWSFEFEVKLMSNDPLFGDQHVIN